MPFPAEKRRAPVLKSESTPLWYSYAGSTLIEEIDEKVLPPVPKPAGNNGYDSLESRKHAEKWKANQRNCSE
jgi:hypothetical protein